MYLLKLYPTNPKVGKISKCIFKIEIGFCTCCGFWWSWCGARGVCVAATARRRSAPRGGAPPTSATAAFSPWRRAAWARRRTFPPACAQSTSGRRARSRRAALPTAAAAAAPRAVARPPIPDAPWKKRIYLKWLIFCYDTRRTLGIFHAINALFINSGFFLKLILGAFTFWIKEQQLFGKKYIKRYFIKWVKLLNAHFFCQWIISDLKPQHLNKTTQANEIKKIWKTF